MVEVESKTETKIQTIPQAQAEGGYKNSINSPVGRGSNPGQNPVERDDWSSLVKETKHGLMYFPAQSIFWPRVGPRSPQTQSLIYKRR